jgi:ribose 5-phosphate isomerase
LFEPKLTNEVKNNRKSFYAYVRSKINVKDVVGPIRAKDGELITDNGEMCNVLIDFSVSVFTDETDLKELPEVKKVIRGKLHAR